FLAAVFFAGAFLAAVVVDSAALVTAVRVAADVVDGFGAGVGAGRGVGAGAVVGPPEFLTAEKIAAPTPVIRPSLSNLRRRERRLAFFVSRSARSLARRRPLRVNFSSIASVSTFSSTKVSAFATAFSAASAASLAR